MGQVSTAAVSPVIWSAPPSFWMWLILTVNKFTVTLHMYGDTQHNNPLSVCT